jgi:hypothetical protein
MNANEPVAWMDEETGCFVYSQYDYEDLDEHGKDGLIPLHTHPAKTLTDEEIEDLLRQSVWALGVNTDWTEDENWNDAITVFKSIWSKK